jgi:hypothetical protein
LGSTVIIDVKEQSISYFSETDDFCKKHECTDIDKIKDDRIFFKDNYYILHENDYIDILAMKFDELGLTNKDSHLVSTVMTSKIYRTVMSKEERRYWSEYEDSIKDLCHVISLDKKSNWFAMKEFQVEYLSNAKTNVKLALINDDWHFVKVLYWSRPNIFKGVKVLSYSELRSLGKLGIYDLHENRIIIKKYLEMRR